MPAPLSPSFHHSCAVCPGRSIRMVLLTLECNLLILPGVVPHFFKTYQVSLVTQEGVKHRWLLCPQPARTQPCLHCAHASLHPHGLHAAHFSRHRLYHGTIFVARCSERPGCSSHGHLRSLLLPPIIASTLFIRQQSRRPEAASAHRIAVMRQATAMR